MNENNNNAGIAASAGTAVDASKNTGAKKQPFVVPSMDISGMKDDPFEFVMPSIEGGEVDL